MKEVVILPGATTAGDDITLPESVNDLDQVILADMGQYTSGSDVAPTDLTIVDSGPGAGEVTLTNETTIVLGDNTIATTVLFVRANELGSDPLPS